jgi:predicted esterase/predicted Ser/Thr protein kinase
MALAAGTQLGSYEILASLGAGGMGEVYRARHLKLGREAAIKVLPSEVATNPERLRRFEREARAASALNHPGIVTIYEIDELEGMTFIAMELVDGKTLRGRLAEGLLAPVEAVRIARSIAEALVPAHAAGIVHRDLKPENVMIARDGRVKLLDFGLAKQVPQEPETALEELTTLSLETGAGVLLGTAPYMSPEQAEGRHVGAVSDQFSLGVVLYEMLAGRRPFTGDSVPRLLSAILTEPAPPLKGVRSGVPAHVDRVVDRCLEKVPAARYPSTQELVDALRRCEERLTGAARRVPGPRSLATALVLLAATAGVGGWWWLRDDIAKWRERKTLAEIDRLSEAGDLYRAWSLVHAVRQKLPRDPEVRRMMERISLPVSVVTDPAGAEVELADYSNRDSPWVSLGRTPLEGVRVPYALARWRISKPGFESFEGAPFGTRPFAALAGGLRLDPAGTRPAGMVRVPGGPYQRHGFPRVELDDYWLDRYEVTNRQFKEFVDNGGYEREEYWRERFVENGGELTRREAMARFVDTTGRPGPSRWELGSYDDGRDDFPVGGVSWYEATAYCRSVGKSLPTLYHWFAATVQDQLSDIVTQSNFGASGPAPVGRYAGISDFGNYDMAGNVKEWCSNETAGRRYALGGSWGEGTGIFRVDADSLPPLSREPNVGFRCARFEHPLDPALLAPVTRSSQGDSPVPVADGVFDAYRRVYAYDRTGLDARVESQDDTSSHWREQTVSFKAAYGDERVFAHLFLPRNVSPPYQPVVWFPGNDAFFLPAGDALASPYLFDFIPRSGRALVYPVYKGMYERRLPRSFTPNELRDLIIQWSKDLGRTLDYLESRQDMDAGALGYYGFSAGAFYGPVFTAVDPRFKASVLLAGGLCSELPPEADPVNFAPRSHVPTMMINGRDDFLCPFDSAERPLYRLLGVPEVEKELVRLKGGHIPSDRPGLIRHVVAWFDRHLGPVEAKGATTDRSR